MYADYDIPALSSQILTNGNGVLQVLKKCRLDI
jgi:hypothetical protein